MVRKDLHLLKKAFRNNFLRKSVVDLKSLGADEVVPKPYDANPASSRPMYEDAVPVLSSPLTSTADFPAHEEIIQEEEKIALARAAQTSRESVAGWLEGIESDTEMHDTENRGDYTLHMSSSEICRELEKADAEQKTRTQRAHFLRSHKQLFSDHHDLFVASKEMIVSHLDTIDTAFALLEVMDALSPHAEALKRVMLEKKRMCEKNLIDLLPVRSRLEKVKTEMGYV